VCVWEMGPGGALQVKRCAPAWLHAVHVRMHAYAHARCHQTPTALWVAVSLALVSVPAAQPREFFALYKACSGDTHGPDGGESAADGVLGVGFSTVIRDSTSPAPAAGEAERTAALRACRALCPGFAFNCLSCQALLPSLPLLCLLLAPFP
jgi:hypothetical protein